MFLSLRYRRRANRTNISETLPTRIRLVSAAKGTEIVYSILFVLFWRENNNSVEKKMMKQPCGAQCENRKPKCSRCQCHRAWQRVNAADVCNTQHRVYSRLQQHRFFIVFLVFAFGWKVWCWDAAHCRLCLCAVCSLVNFILFSSVSRVFSSSSSSILFKLCCCCCVSLFIFWLPNVLEFVRTFFFFFRLEWV